MLFRSVIGVGTLLVIARRPVENIQAATHRVIRRIPSSERSFNAVLHGINLLANRVAAITQTGSLPVSLLIIFATVAVVPLVPFIGEMGALPQFVEKPLHIPLVAIILGAALGAALVKRRISAVVMLGAVGFAMAGLWEVQGAPDLALTQFAIETLGTVLFVLVLRFLPGRFIDLAPAVMRPVRLSVSALVGAAVFVFAIAASNARDDVSAPNISEEMIERSYPDGKGQNVVNVILVDFRGVDTMGEITVLVVAGVGAAAVARADRRRRREDIEADFASANGIPASSEEVST